MAIRNNFMAKKTTEIAKIVLFDAPFYVRVYPAHIAGINLKWLNGVYRKVILTLLTHRYSILRAKCSCNSNIKYVVFKYLISVTFDMYLVIWGQFFLNLIF